MSGHSKWKTIRLQKGKADVERGKLFGKLAREITIAARLGGGQTDANPRLRLAVEKAKQSSMPADNIKRAIEKGTGDAGGANYEDVVYEGYGPGGVAVLVTAATDNRNRTVADLRHLFNKYGGNLGESGSVAWQFARQGIITVATRDGDAQKGDAQKGDAQKGDAPDEDALLEIALEAGAEDVERAGDAYLITTPPEELDNVRAALVEKGITPASAESEMTPQNVVQLDGETARRVLRLIEALEDHDDVQSVAANLEFDDAMLEENS
jgi:YebC/PmpR family DNA-binding regulatory protein